MTATSQTGPVGFGPALRRAWVGYRCRLDAAMADAGFFARGFPDGRVLRLGRATACTISDIGRQLGMTRQGAAKVVSGLEGRGYVSVTASPTSGREKLVSTTERGLEYLGAQRRAARRIERQLQKQLGPEAWTGLVRLLGELGGSDEQRLRAYLRRSIGTGSGRT